MTSDTGFADTELPVQKQLDAYNARDIDAFMQCWAEDCQYYEFPARLVADGAQAIRARHVARFEESNLFGTLHSRISLDDIVIDHETVTRTFRDGPGEVDVIAIYEVKAGKIVKAWFKTGSPRHHASDVFSITAATIEHAAMIRSLTRAAYAKWMPVIGREPRPMMADYEKAVTSHRIDMMWSDATPVALIEMVPRSDHLLIENVAVLPAFQGRGLGRRLLAHAEGVAISLRFAELRLYTNKAFAANVALYQRAGYAIDREEPFMGGFTVYMSKRI